MIAVFVNMAAVIVGSAIGILFSNKIRENYIKTIVSALALVTFVIGISSAINTQNLLCVIVCMAVGSLVGELLCLDRRINGAGIFLKEKLIRGKYEASRFTEGFVSSCILFCVGSMTIMGSLEAGIHNNYSIIFAKSALDFVSAILFGAAMGVGVTFSSVFILIFQGSLTLLAGLIAPYLSQAVVTEMSAVGGAILIGMGFNMLELSDKRVKVANMLPSIFLPILYIPFSTWIGGLIT